MLMQLQLSREPRNRYVSTEAKTPELNFLNTHISYGPMLEAWGACFINSANRFIC